MFDTAYMFVGKEEGGYVNDKSDSGGATNGGVTQATFDAWRKSQKLEPKAVRYISSHEKKAIFKNIWEDCKASQLPAGINILHFDYAVNAGNFRAATTLQECVGVEVDGKIGPKTLVAVAEADQESLIKKYTEARRAFYTSLAARRPKDQKFLKGWLLRTTRAEKEALHGLHLYRRNGPSETGGV